MPLRSWKTAILWIFGSISILLGSMISGRLDISPGVDEMGFILALVISIMLFLIGGLLWISVAIAARGSKH
ncbi:MAG: hypothetical protein HY361_00115 [Candidatus Aenigmarchaeota archaeon]|nr:hypothetical protein [Candidatus Aenigmarchaeota archaeon]